MKLTKDDMYSFQRIIEHLKICIMDPSAEDQLQGKPMSDMVINEDGTLCFFADDHADQSNTCNSKEIFITYVDPRSQSLFSAVGTALLCIEEINDNASDSSALVKIKSMELEDEDPVLSNIVSGLVNILKSGGKNSIN